MNAFDKYVALQRKRVETHGAHLTRSAKEARQRRDIHYVGSCKLHGDMLFLTCDNSCPVCCWVARTKRNKQAPSFNRIRHQYNEIKSRASDRGLSCTLTLDKLRALMDESTVCPIFNKNYAPKGIGCKRDDLSKSVDRLNSNLGYTDDNVVIISDRANRIKNDGTAEEHLQIGIWMLMQEGLTADSILETFKCINNQL